MLRRVEWSIVRSSSNKEKFYNASFEVLMEVLLKICIFWDVTPYILVNRCLRCEGLTL